MLSPKKVLPRARRWTQSARAGRRPRRRMCGRTARLTRRCRRRSHRTACGLDPGSTLRVDRRTLSRRCYHDVETTGHSHDRLDGLLHGSILGDISGEVACSGGVHQPLFCGPSSNLRLSLVPVPIDDPSSVEVIGGQLDSDPIARRDPNSVPAHPAGNVGDQLVTALQHYLEHHVRKCLADDRVEYDRRLFVRPNGRGGAGAAAAGSAEG